MPLSRGGKACNLSARDFGGALQYLIRQQKSVMSSQLHRVEVTTSKQLQLLLRDTPITLTHTIKDPTTPFFTLVPPPPTISPTDLQLFTGKTFQTAKTDLTPLMERVAQFCQVMLNILEQNQTCRSSWVDGVLRGRAERQIKVDVKGLREEKRQLKELMDECRFGVDDRDQLLQLISSRRKDIFLWRDESHILQTLKTLHLPQLPQQYELYRMPSQQQYLKAYESTIEQLSTLHTATTHYLQTQNPSYLPSISPQSLLLDPTPLHCLLTYTLYFCDQHFQKLKQLREQIRSSRERLARAVIRVYYLVATADSDIDRMNASLGKVQETVLQWRQQQQPQSKDRVALMNDQTHKSITSELGQVQNAFSLIFSFLTNHNEPIFTIFYERQINKRAIKLCKVKDKTAHIEKLRFNADYAEMHLLRLKSKQNNPAGLITQQMKQLEELRAEFGPIMSDNQFRVLFEEIQRAIVFVGKDAKYGSWRARLLHMEDTIIKEHMFQKGTAKRKMNKQPSSSTSMAKSTVSINLNRGQVNPNKTFFQQTYLQITQNNTNSPPSPTKTRKMSDSINKNQIHKEGVNYLSSIRGEHAEQLIDQSHFKVYLLPKLTRKVQQTLLLIPYSEQPLNMQLTRLLENLRLIPSLIRPEINQEKFELIFWPRINSPLFSQLKNILSTYQTQLGETSTNLSQDPSKNNLIQDELKCFIELRLKFLKVLLYNIDKLEQLVTKVDQMYLGKESYDVAEEGTNNIVLTLLLAQKQVRAIQLSLQDVKDKSSSRKAVGLMTNKLLPLFDRSLPKLFQIEYSTTTLQSLLQLCERAYLSMSDSYQCMDSAIRVLEDMKVGRITRSLHSLMDQFFQDLKSLKSRLQNVIKQTKSYRNVGAETVRRQLVRVQEFMEICQKGEGISCELIDEKALHFMQLVKTLAT